jgi:hypothetical protein
VDALWLPWRADVMPENTDFQNNCLFAVYYLTKIGQRLADDEPLAANERVYLGTLLFGLRYVQQQLNTETDESNPFRHDDDETFY